MSAPHLWVVAGPNGSGKTTLTAHHFAGRVPVVNPDEIATAINANHNGDPAVMLRAGRLAIAERESLLAARKSFAIETTLTGRSELDLMKRASAQGYKVSLIFIGIKDANLSASRVAGRVKNGGHPVPIADILRRFDRSLVNLSVALNIAVRSLVLDNTGKRRRLLLSVDQGQVKHLAKALPAWAAKTIPRSVIEAKQNHTKLSR